MASPSQSQSQSQQTDDINSITEGVQSISVNNRTDEKNDEKKDVLPAPTIPSSPSPLPSYTLEWIASLIRSGSVRNVIVMCGAGISVSCGIPDFRSKETGLYDNLSKYNLPHPTAIFEIGYFRTNPKPFFMLAKELYPTKYAPSPTHHFIRLLHDKGVLLRCFTQNIDGLEGLAGLPSEKVVQAHGGFSSHDKCIDCAHEIPSEETKQRIFNDEIVLCPKCGGYVKPQIVFFGEALPKRFHESLPDFSQADLLLVMGTSLAVQPFASLINNVKSHVPRVLLNNEMVGHREPIEDNENYRMLKMQLGAFKAKGDMATVGAIENAIERLERMSSGGFDFKSTNNRTRRDVFHKCLLDEGVRELCRQIGSDWEGELDALIQKGYKPPQPAVSSPTPLSPSSATVDARL